MSSALDRIAWLHKKDTSRDYKQEYREYHGKPAQIKARAERNKARSEMGLKVGDSREVDHKNPLSHGGSNSKRNLRVVSRDTNRHKGSSVDKADDWQESKHPRAANGQFGSGGGSGKGKESQGAKRKRTTQARRAESTAQTTLSGGKAVQSLLSGGGSALDRFGWLNTSKPKEPPKPVKETPKTPEKPQASINTPKADIEAAKNTIRENIKSGKLKKETVIAAVKTLYERANEAEHNGDDTTAHKLDQQAEIMADAAKVKGELYSRGITQIRGRASHIGPGILPEQRPPKNSPKQAIPPEGIWTGRGPRPAADPKREVEIRRLGAAPKPNNSLQRARQIEAYQNKVIARGEKLDSFKEGDQNLALYEHNGRTYIVDHDHPDQFSSMSKDDWRRLKDELTGDERPRSVAIAHPKAKPIHTATDNPHVHEASSSDIFARGRKIDEHGNRSLHEYNDGLYMVTQGDPRGMKVSRPAWESLKYG